MNNTIIPIILLALMLSSCAEPRTGDWISGYKYVRLSNEMPEGDKVLASAEFKRVGIKVINEVDEHALSRDDMKTVLTANHKIELGVLFSQNIYIDLGDWNTDNPITSTYGKDGFIIFIGKKSREELISWGYNALLDKYGSFNSRAVGTRPKPKSERDFIEVFITSKPDRPYAEIGIISAKSDGEKNKLIEHFKNKARKMGGDAIIISGKGFVEESGLFKNTTTETTEAVVIVYKD